MSGDLFGYPTVGVEVEGRKGGCYYHYLVGREARDPAKYPVIHRTSAHNKNYQGQNVGSADVEKPGPTQRKLGCSALRLSHSFPYTSSSPLLGATCQPSLRCVRIPYLE